MLNFYNSGNGIGQTTILPPSWNYAKTGLERNLKTVKDYYYNRPHAVKNQHFLVRLLTTLGVAYTMHLERFYDIVDARALQYGMSLKMTSSLYRGAFFKNVFYGGDTLEILVANNEAIDPYYTYQHWKTAQSVRVIDHPKSDLALLLPNGRMGSTGDGIAVVEINIPTLAIQYKAFMDEQMNRASGGMMSPLSTAQFVHMYVLPNMLDSHLNIALFNRAYHLSVGAPLGQASIAHPFYLTNFSKEVDKVYLEQIKFLKGSDNHFKTVLRTFQCLNGSFIDALVLPDTANTRQIHWVNYLARLKAMDFMTDIPKDHGRARNTMELNQFFRQMKMFDQDKTLRHGIPGELQDSLEIMIASIQSKTRMLRAYWSFSYA